jgi:transposase, IS5 family
MIVDRYPPVNLFAIVPQRALGFDPELRELARLLEDDALFQQVKADLARRRPHSLHRGRPSVEITERLTEPRRIGHPGGC